MGFFNRTPEASNDDVPVNFEIELNDVESLYRLAEQDDAVAAVLENHRRQIEELKVAAEGGGGTGPDSWKVSENDAQRASDVMKELGYIVNPSLFHQLD